MRAARSPDSSPPPQGAAQPAAADAPTGPAPLSRRTVLATGGLAAAGLAVGGSPGFARRRRRGHSGQELRPISMAMHIHGSFSEGMASYGAHLRQPRRTGVNVIWWTDHDFRVAAHGYRQRSTSPARSSPRAS